MRIIKENSLVVFVDIQERLFPHIHENDLLGHQIIKLFKGTEILGLPYLVTQQYSAGLGPTIQSLKKEMGDFEPIEKISFSCCDEPSFIKKIDRLNRKSIIIAGIETHVCILQTVIDLIGLGFKAIVVQDCVSSRNLADKTVAIERMRQEGAVISTLESLLFELTRFSRTETFKAISNLVK